MSQKIKTSVEIDGSLTANSIVKSGGTASQILAADGSVVTAGSGVTISGGTISASGSAGVLSFNTRTGAVTLTSGDVTTALGYTPYNASNPNGYISSYTETDTLASVTGRGALTSGNIFTPVNGGLFFNGNGLYGSGVYGSGNDLWFNAGSTQKAALNSSGDFTANNSLRSPIFYDSSDTSYYTNPASTSVLSSVVLRGASAINFYGAGSGTYNIGSIYSSTSINSWEAPLETDSYTAARVPFILTWRGGYAAKGGLKLTGDASGELGGNVILHAGNYSSYAVPTSRTITINGTSYDLSANRSWTVTGTETDTLATVTGRGSATSTRPSFDGGITVNGQSYVTANGYFVSGAQGFRWNDSSGNYNNVIMRDNGTTWFRNYLETPDSMRAPIFYDSNDTGYYWDPANNASHRFQTPYGYIDIGPKNTSYCHIYTDRGSFYFNAQLEVLGNRVLNAGNYSNYAWPLEGGWKPASLASSTRLRGATSPDGGEFALAYSGGQIHPYADGFFYQNEGAYRVMDSNSIGDYTVGNYRTIADYSSDSTWYMRPNGRFVFANAHDWTQSFELLLPSGGSNNNTWAHFGQRQSNATNGNFTGVSIRRYISGASNLGDLQAGNVYGRIFYDDDNTGYYLDPNGTSNLNVVTGNEFYSNGWFRNNSNNTGLYNQANANHFYSRGASRWGITGNSTGSDIYLDFYGNHQTTYRGSVHADTNSSIGFLTNDQGWGFRLETNKNAHFHGNTVYIGADGQSSSNIIMRDGDHGDRQIHCNSNRVGFLNQSGGWGSWCEDNGNWISDTSVQSPIFYDYNNTGYYLNPDGLSNVNIISAGGYIFSGNYIESAGAIYGTIFYDNNNRSYYCDPSATSNFIGLTVANTINGNISGNANTSNTDYLMSDRDFPSGTLIQTSINYNNSEGDPFVLEIKGNSYGNGMPMDVQIQGYIYANTIINTGGYSNGFNVSGIRAIRYNGNLCFWFPTQGYWNGYTVKAYTAYGGRQVNKVTSVTNTGLPTTDKQVNFTPAISLRSDNYRGYSDFSGAVYGTVFYDNNNTGYYVDPASTSNFNAANFAGSVNLFGGYGPGSGPGLGFENQNSFIRLAFWGMDFYDWNHGIQMVIDNGYVSANNSFRAPTFYDSNNTGYYVDPASTSSLNVLSMANKIIVGSFPNSTVNSGEAWLGRAADRSAGTMTVQLGGNLDRKFEVVDYGWTTVNFSVNGYGAAEASGSMRAPIFYDSNNTGYYLDPTGTSQLNVIWANKTVSNNTPAIQIRGGSGGPRFQTYGLDANADAWMGLGTDMGGNSYEHSVYFPTWPGGGGTSRCTIGDYNGSTYNTRFTVLSNGNVIATGDVTAYSDRRVKENIHTIDKALDKVNNLRGVYYNRIDSEDKKRKIGVIAQEILEVVPEVVNQDTDEMYNVSYGNLAGLFIEAIKEQQTQIEELKELVNKLINK